MGYRVAYKASVAKDIRELDKPTARRVLAKLEKVLGDDPDAGVPLKGDFKGLFRYRIGDYRVIYAKIGGGVLILRIVHRKEAYG